MMIMLDEKLQGLQNPLWGTLMSLQKFTEKHTLPARQRVSVPSRVVSMTQLYSTDKITALEMYSALAVLRQQINMVEVFEFPLKGKLKKNLNQKFLF